MGFWLKAWFVNFEFFSLLFLLGCVLCLWFVERLSPASIFLFDGRNLKLSFGFLGIICVLLGVTEYDVTTYTPEFGLVNDLWSKTGRVCAALLLFTVIGLERVRSSWINTSGSSPLGELFLLISLLIAICGLMSCVNLVLMIILFETMSLLLYILGLRTAFKDVVLGEAVMKYVLASGVSSSFLYLGLFFIFSGNFLNLGFNRWGDVQFIYEFNEMFLSTPFSLQAIGLIFVLIGFAFKFGLVPFHFWMADLYQGLSLRGLGLFMILPKLGLFFALVRLDNWFSIYNMFNSGAVHILFTFLGISSVLLGSFMMLHQWNIRRLLAFSSIHNFGYIFIAFGTGNLEGLVVSSHFLLYYVFVTAGLLSILKLVSTLQGERDLISDMRLLFFGLFRSNKALATLLFVYFFIFMGLPPSYGFFMKAQVIGNILGAEDVFFNGVLLGILLIFASAVSVFVYLHLLTECLFLYTGSVTSLPLFDRIESNGYELTLLGLVIFIGIYFGLGWCFVESDFITNLIWRLFI